MKDIPKGSIDLIVTSPPYFNARPEYSSWETYDDYLTFMHKVLANMSKVLSLTGRIALNIPDGYGRNPWIPLYADVCKLMQEQYILRGSIVWNKNNGAGKTSWGSWRSSSNPCIIDEHEMIIVAHKQYPKIDNACEIDKELFFSLVHSVWNIKAETNRKNHPAPFPLEIAERLITFLSGENSIILDPLLGSGTTALACRNLNRSCIGIEINPDYYQLAKDRLSRVQAQLL